MIDGEGLKLDEIKKELLTQTIIKLQKVNMVQEMLAILAQMQMIYFVDSKRVFITFMADLLDAAVLNSGIFKNSKSFDDEIDTNVIAQKFDLLWDRLLYDK